MNLQDNYDNAPETAVSSNAYHDYHEVKKNICLTFYCLCVATLICNYLMLQTKVAGISIPKSEEEEEERESNDRKLELGKSDI